MFSVLYTYYFWLSAVELRVIHPRLLRILEMT